MRSLLRKVFGCHAPRPLLKPQTRSPLRVEDLEARRVLSGQLYGTVFDDTIIMSFDAQAQAYLFTVQLGAQATRSFTVAVASLDASGIRIDLWGGDDTLRVESTGGHLIQVTGGGGYDRIDGPHAATTWQLTGNGAGMFANVHFTDFDRLNGGISEDTFRISPGAAIPVLDGGVWGANTLDFSAWSDGVLVNLGTEVAPTGSVIGFMNVLGGSGDDLITGSSADNTLHGGGGNDTLNGLDGDDVLSGDNGDDTLRGRNGRDLLIGGKGLDAVAGDGGEDILIGDAVTYTSDDTLRAIVGEWSRTDLTYAQRVQRLRTGPTVQSPRTPLLNTSCIRDDNDRDKLTGGTEYDWFFSITTAYTEIADRFVNNKAPLPPSEEVN